MLAGIPKLVQNPNGEKCRAEGDIMEPAFNMESLKFSRMTERTLPEQS